MRTVGKKGTCSYSSIAFCDADARCGSGVTKQRGEKETARDRVKKREGEERKTRELFTAWLLSHRFLFLRAARLLGLFATHHDSQPGPPRVLISRCGLQALRPLTKEHQRKLLVLALVTSLLFPVWLGRLDTQHNSCTQSTDDRH